MSCDEVRLEALLPTMEEAGAEAAARHLTGCPTCRERLRVMVCLMALRGAPRRISRLRAAARWLAAAAVLLGLVLSAPPPPDRAAPAGSSLSTGVAYPRFPLETRSSPVRPDPREAGFQAYLEGDFAEAARMLRRWADTPESAFYLGVSLHLSGRPREALDWLGRAQKDPRWRRPALWYRANALLDLERIGEAKTILLELAALAGEFHKEAGELLSDPALRPARPKEEE